MAKLARKRKALKSKESKERKKLKEKLDKIKKQLECKESIQHAYTREVETYNLHCRVATVEEEDERKRSQEI